MMTTAVLTVDLICDKHAHQICHFHPKEDFLYMMTTVMITVDLICNRHTHETYIILLLSEGRFLYDDYSCINSKPYL